MNAASNNRHIRNNGESLIVSSVHADFASTSNCANLFLAEQINLMKGLVCLPLWREKDGEFDMVTCRDTSIKSREKMKTVASVVR